MNSHLGKIETRFAELIWTHQPLTTKELIELCGRSFGWKRTTTYTVLKKLCNKGLFQTENSMITALISKEEFQALKCEQFIEETFSGSLPAFLAAFGSTHKLTEKEVAKLQELINAS